MTDWKGCTPLVFHKRTGTAQFYHPPGHRRRDSLLPCSLTGRVFRSLEDTCGPAYLGALEQAAKAMAQVDGLQGVMGGDICWGDEALAKVIWHGLLESGARDGTELQLVWRILQMEAFQSASWLEKILMACFLSQFRALVMVQPREREEERFSRRGTRAEDSFLKRTWSYIPARKLEQFGAGHRETSCPPSGYYACQDTTPLSLL